MVDAFVAWSGWLLSVLGFIATVVSMRQVARERARNERMSATLSRMYATPRADHPVASTGERDERIRAVLIRVASSAQPLSAALARSRPQGVCDEDVVRVAEDLRKSGLLTFETPLTPKTPLGLNR